MLEGKQYLRGCLSLHGDALGTARRIRPLALPECQSLHGAHERAAEGTGGVEGGRVVVGLIRSAQVVPRIARMAMPATLMPASQPTIAPKAIARSPRPTSPSAPTAAAPCGGSQPCRAPATLSHSPVIPHDHSAD